MAEKKSVQFALLTVFATILVVIGHSDITDDFKALWIYKWVYSFHMPLFFFISGFLMFLTNPISRTKEISYRKFISKKAYRLLLPFFFINSIIFVIKATLFARGDMVQNAVEFDVNSFINHTIFSPIGFMWFLPALFCIFCITYPILKYIHGMRFTCRRSWGGVFVMITFAGVFLLADIFLSGISFMQIGKAIHYEPYFLVGGIYCLYKHPIDNILRKYAAFIFLISGIISVLLVFRGLFAALSGIIFSVMLSLYWRDKGRDVIIRLSTYTYSIFLLSYFPQMLVRGPIFHHCVEINQYIFSVLSFISGLILPIVICMFIRKVRKYSRFVDSLAFLVGI